MIATRSPVLTVYLPKLVRAPTRLRVRAINLLSDREKEICLVPKVRPQMRKVKLLHLRLAGSANQTQWQVWPTSRQGARRLKKNLPSLPAPTSQLPRRLLPNLLPRRRQMGQLTTANLSETPMSISRSRVSTRRYKVSARSRVRGA